MYFHNGEIVKPYPPISKSQVKKIRTQIVKHMQSVNISKTESEKTHHETHILKCLHLLDIAYSQRWKKTEDISL